MLKKLMTPLTIIGISGALAFGLLLIMASRVEAAKMQFYSAQEQLQLFRQEVWYLQKLDREKLEKRLLAELGRFPAPNQLRLLIEEITEMGSAASVSFDSIAPREPIESAAPNESVTSLFRQVPIEMRIRGEFEDVSNFLAGLSNLSTGVVSVQNFEMSSPSPSNKGLINLTLTATAYVKKEADQQVLGDQAPVGIMSSGEKTKSRFRDIDRDPFAKSTGGRALNIEGIIYDPVNPLVLIGGELKKEGDVVGDATILEIQRNSVVIQRKGEKINIHITKA